MGLTGRDRKPDFIRRRPVAGGFILGGLSSATDYPSPHAAFMLYFKGFRQSFFIFLSNPGALMFIVHVHVQVKPEFVQAFKQASIDNASHSVQEPGVARFDVIQQSDDPTRFVLVEVYRHADAPARHKETAHYARWRDTVAEMMAEPRVGIRYENIFPEEHGW
jgi:quinol monooxygenase YgiN